MCLIIQYLEILIGVQNIQHEESLQKSIIISCPFQSGKTRQFQMRFYKIPKSANRNSFFFKIREYKSAQKVVVRKSMEE